MMNIRKDLGYVDPDDDITSRIKEQLDTSLEASVDPDVVRRAARAALAEYPLEGSSGREIKDRLREIRKTGWPVEHYSGMNIRQLRVYFGRLRTEISAVAEESCPEVIGEVKEENARRIQEDYHY